MVVLALVLVLDFELVLVLRPEPSGSSRHDRLSGLILFICIFAGLSLSGRLASVRVLQLPGHHIWYLWIGLAAMWSGIALRVWSVISLGRFFTPAVIIQSDHRVITAGPYRYLRHPSYSGAMLALLGYGLTPARALSLIALAACLAVGFGYRIWVEEAQLTTAMGDAYRDYARQTQRLVPFLF